ncbi:MAG: T9SS type A sorting domain-containing protein [Bacteroidia bacterium]
MQKKFLTLLCFLLATSLLHAQYFYVPHVNAGQNPGGLNADNEYPVGGGQPAGWTSINAGNAATPVWTPAQTLPFAFNFNGSPVTQYIAATSGVVTFDVATGLAAPAVANTALPSAAIPDKSVCAWGITGSGTNDNICYKTFGTAPNRQHWIIFSSYTNPGTTCWTYWGIALEETSNKIYVVDMRNAGCATTLTVGVQVDGTSASMLASSPNTPVASGSDFTPADNSYWEFIQGTQPAVNAEMTAFSTIPYIVVGNNATITGTISNFGSAVLNDINLKYRTNGTTYTNALTNLNIAPYATYNFTHTQPLNIPSAGGYFTEVWLEAAGDVNNADDTLSLDIQGLAFLPTKRVVFEEGTGTWCGWCPRGAVFMDSLHIVHPNTSVLIAVHNGDPMVVTAYDAGIGGLIGGYPSGVVDRHINDTDPSDFFDNYDTQIQEMPPVDVTVTPTYDAASSTVSIVVSGHFAAALDGDYRFNAVVTEDDVKGTTNDWAQTNYYSSSSQNIALVGAGHNWQTSPNPVPAASMEYDDVARAILGTFGGQTGSLPTTIAANSVHSYTFTYPVPANVNGEKLNFIGWVQKGGNTGRILNANQAKSPVTSVQAMQTADFSAKVFPNPMTTTNGNLELMLEKATDLTINVLDVAGRVVKTEKIQAPSGQNLYNLDFRGLSSGIYHLNIQSEKGSVNTKVVVK